MATPANLPHKGPESVSLSRAVLCNDCDEITAATNGHCPICGSTALVSLAKILNRNGEEAGKEGDNAIDAVNPHK